MPRLYDNDEFRAIEAINDQRRALLKRSYLTGIDILFQWKHTLLTSIVFDFELYSTLLVFALGRIFQNALTTQSIIALTAVGVSSTFISFLLVFYLTQCYTRYTAQYEAAMGCKGRIFDAVILARTIMDGPSAWRLFRYMNAAHLLGYIGLTDTYTENNLFKPLNAKYALLNDAEISRIREIGFNGGCAHREVLAWAIEAIRTELNANKINIFDANTLVGEVCMLRAKMGLLYDFADQPIPFSYIHFINLMVFLYLPIFSFGVAVNYAPDTPANATNSVFGFIFVMFYCMAVLGLRGIAQRLQDPFGDDVEDLSVLHYVRFNIEMSRRLLLAASVHPISAEGETSLHAKLEENIEDAAFPKRRLSSMASARSFNNSPTAFGTVEYDVLSPLAPAAAL